MEVNRDSYKKLEESSFYNIQPHGFFNEPLLEQPAAPLNLSSRKKLFLRFGIFLFCTTFLVLGRLSVPDNEPPCIVDKVQNWLDGVNYFILTNTGWRNAMQIMCSGFMDTLFILTGGYWIVNGKSSSLVVTVLLFYISRAMVQAIWESPFPKGFWWYNPGFPSLVVPYGRGSDFFFSGHIGFVTICGTEWKRNKKPWMVVFCLIGGIYTMFILLSYQVHYSIDIFTGIVFAHWCHMMVESYKDPIDNFFVKCFLLARKVVGQKTQQAPGSVGKI